jgi:hypothetical protein
VSVQATNPFTYYIGGFIELFGIAADV